MSEFYYKDLSEKLIGIFFDTYNEEEYGYREKYYETVIADKCVKEKIKFQRQYLVKLKNTSNRIIYRKVDLNVETKIIIELKIGNRLTKSDFDQMNEYLKALDYRLGLLVLFSPQGVVVRRVVNVK